MKRMKSVVASSLLGLAVVLSGCASWGIVHDAPFGNTASVDAVDYHLTALQQHQGKATNLEQKIQKLEDRINTVNQKPYRDPKGFRRSGWKRLVGTWKQEVNDLRKQMAWHQNEIARMQDSVEEPFAVGDKEIGKS